MENGSILKVLLVAEGSGGHLIPALELAKALAQRGASIKLWYAQRPQTDGLARALAQRAQQQGVEVDPIPVSTRNVLERFWRCGQLWSQSQHCF